MLWQTTKTLLTTTDLVTKTFLAFFIWETQKDLNTILFFGLAYFVAIPLASLLSGFISDNIEPKISLLFGNWFQIIQLLFLIIFSSKLTLQSIMIIGLIGGLGEGFRNIAIQVIDHDKKKLQDEAKFYAREAFTTQLLKLIVPISAAFLVGTQDGYTTLFKLTIGLLILVAGLVVFIKNEHITGKFNLKSILSSPGTNKDKIPLIQGVFFEGLSEGITLTILPIIILSLVGTVLNWGFLNTALASIAIIVSYLLSKLISDVNTKLVYALGALLFASASIFFISQFNFLILVIFLIAKTLMDVIKETSYYSSLARIIKEDRKEHHLYAEYQFLIESIATVGRVIPIIILIYLGTNIFDELIIRMALLTVGLLPLVALSFLGKSVVFDETYKEETKIKSIRKENIPTLRR